MESHTLKTLILLNFFAGCLHLALAIVTGVIGNISLTSPTYVTKNTFVYNSSSEGFDIDPRYVKGTEFPITALTVAFFAVTSLFHFSNITCFAKLYFCRLEKCQTPTRWLEYSITATIMASIICFISGGRGLNTIVGVSGLIATTMLFGYFSELLNKPDFFRDEWEITTFRERAFPHFCGWIPYAFAWFIILYSYFGGGGTCASPWWVITIIVGQFVLFSLFVVPQIFQLCCRPSKFVYGEMIFISLSFVSKAFLGIILLFAGITQDTWDSFDDIDVNTTCDVIDLA